MNYRLATVLASKSLGTTTTETIDLNLKDPISRLDIVWKPTRLATAMLAAFAAAIEKIELVDGSDVLHSLSGYQNQALCLYDRRAQSLNGGMLLGGATQHILFGIDFGRYLFDPELAFDPTRFRNPQLKITHDSTKLSATTVTHSLEIFAHCFDEKVISPIGFLMAKQLMAYVSPTADTYEYIDLPTDHPIRQLLLRAFHENQDPYKVADYLKLSEDNDKRIPLDIELGTYCNRMRGTWQILTDQIVEMAGAEGLYVMYVTPTDETVTVAGLGQGGAGTTILNAGPAGGKVSWSGNAYIMGHASGYLPHHCIQFPFGNQQDLSDWYDVTKLGSLVARIMSAANVGSGSEISLVLQQLRRY